MQFLSSPSCQIYCIWGQGVTVTHEYSPAFREKKRSEQEEQRGRWKRWGKDSSHEKQMDRDRRAGWKTCTLHKEWRKGVCWNKTGKERRWQQRRWEEQITKRTQWGWQGGRGGGTVEMLQRGVEQLWYEGTRKDLRRCGWRCWRRCHVPLRGGGRVINVFCLFSYQTITDRRGADVC